MIESTYCENFFNYSDFIRIPFIERTKYKNPKIRFGILCNSFSQLSTLMKCRFDLSYLLYLNKYL